MNTNAVASSYARDVIGPGDDVSGILKEACMGANKFHAHINNEESMQGSNIRLQYPLVDHAEALLESQTDGVGTKVRIYMRQFNLMYETFKQQKDELTDHMMNTSALLDWDGFSEPPGATINRKRKEFQETANELMYRMMLDLYAMIVDDFRRGHVAISVTDIIDINHIKIGKNDPDNEQGTVWANAMKYALESVIKTTQIALIAGETAILGAGDNEKTQTKITKELLGRLTQVDTLLRTVSSGADAIAHELKVDLELILNPPNRPSLAELGNYHNITEGRMELNIGGSGNGVLNGDKLVEMQEGDVVVAFFEQKTKGGVISPRANGISAIRRLESIFGDSWTDRTLTEFFSHPKIADKGGSAALKQKFETQGLSMNMKIWDVATGRTTVFNPFISRELLGGMNRPPKYNISGLAHMTGNPPRKGAELIGDRKLSMSIDYSDVEIPQIVEMCMLAEGLTFSEGFSMWNMGIPYMVTCRAEDADKIMKDAQTVGYDTGIVGKVETSSKDSRKPTVSIKYGDERQDHIVENLLIAGN